MFVQREATILHADLDAFYASVEQRDNPGLRGRPVIVGGGVVLAASYEAKAYGVRTAMGGRQARALCPGAIVVEPRMSAYSDASKRVFQIFEDTTPLATLASNFVLATPTVIGRPTRSRTTRRRRTAISTGGPETRRSPPTSRNASSIDSPSTSGVVSSKIWNTLLLASE